MPSLPAKSRFQIPAVIDPPNTVCLTMTIPDDPVHIANLLGAIYAIAFGPNYENDDAHSAKQLVQVWRKYYSTIAIGDCLGPCPPPLLGGLEEDFEMPLRIDCDCNVFVTCCDGTEKQILTSDQVKALIQQQPGEGAPQPPAGGCVTYSGTLQANQRFLIPTVVNTGDTITVLGAKGLVNDGTEVIWRNYKGNEVLAGADIGAPFFQSTDVLPTAYHESLIVRIGSTYYPVSTPLAVPSGVVNEQPTLLINTTSFPDMSGSMDLSVEVCNNATPTWSHIFDFTKDSQGWFLNPVPPTQTGTDGEYVPGVGWTASYTQFMTTVGYRVINILSPVVASTQITGMQIFYTGGFGVTTGPSQNDQMYTINSGVATSQASHVYTAVPASPWTETWSPATADQVAFGFFVGVENCSCDPGGHLEVSRIVVTGLGADPF